MTSSTKNLLPDVSTWPTWLKWCGIPRNKQHLNGAEFLTVRTCMDQIIDLCNSSYYLDILVCESSYVWGDNKSRVQSSTFPYTKLHKRHNILSYYFVWNMVAQDYINRSHIPSKYNIEDILSKNWSYQSCWEFN